MTTMYDLIAKRVLDGKLKELEQLKEQEKDTPQGSGESDQIQRVTEEIGEQVNKFRSLGIEVPDISDLPLGVSVAETSNAMRQVAMMQLKDKLILMSEDSEVKNYNVEKHCHAIVRRFMQHKNTIDREFEYVTYQQVYKNVAPQFRRRFELALGILVRLGIVQELITKGKIKYKLNAKGVL